MTEKQKPGVLFEESAAIIARLRAPDGCPWDREQTPASIRKYTLEETYEVLDAIERRDWPHLAEELGDLLLQVLFYAQMADEAGDFTLGDVLTGLNRKLVRRHPHVFGAEAASAAGNQAAALAAVPAENGSGAVLANWRAIKAQEKAGRASADSAGAPPGYLAGVLRDQSALAEAAKLGSAAAHAGFDWPDPRALLEKVREEAAEVEEELAHEDSFEPGRADLPAKERLVEELGDLLFTVANLTRHLKQDPEMALRDANAKFRRRFEAMEADQQAAGRRLEELNAEELEAAWAAVKAAERLTR